ncbi:STAS-like domain-containing protein [Pseudomonas sp. B21-053]|uniref:STAS-like domain-containing protein n=1 Tax=Pseudomonas sp. B21-053 TaxID=2895493 RepID=UPI002230F467|nr:STAS-like domain-containing protein [Pseudomonas sp. B21-053]UZE14767.1 STAS-like domain-containing protein [Pseudomonas sp. B21-053]
MKSISLARDFTKFPAGRFKDDGPYSGELFREKYLEPALASDEPVVVELDGARGYGSSFLEEAFGGLVRLGFPAEKVLARISFVSKDTSLISEIQSYIRESIGPSEQVH